MSVSSLARADAAFQEQVHAQWRDWRAYLQAHLLLLDAATDERQRAFERAEAREEQIAQAERTLALLSAGSRALFDGIREARRQQVQATLEGTSGSSTTRLPDPDTVDRQVLGALLAEAEGTAEGVDRTPGWGEVPLHMDGATQWYRVNVVALRDAPNAASYAVGQHDGDDARRRILLACAIGVATIIFVVAWFLWPRGGVLPIKPDDLTPTGNGAAATVWPVRQMLLSTAQGPTVTVTLTPTTALDWATTIDGQMTGTWRTSAFAPLQLCAPEKLLIEQSIARLQGDGEVPERVYALSSARGPVTDVVIEPCAGDAHATRYGVLQTTGALLSQGVPSEAALPGGARLGVQSITVVGPGQQPTLPAGQAQVVVRVRAPSLDWTLYAPTLTLATGQVVQTPERTATADGVELRYLVSLPTAALDAVWSITPPNGSARLRWRTTLAPPPSRAAVLNGTLVVGAVQPLRRATDDALVLRVSVTNRGRTPLQLTRDDITLTYNGTPVTLPDLAAYQQPLAPLEARTFDVPLPDVANTAALILTVGTARFDVRR